MARRRRVTFLRLILAAAFVVAIAAVAAFQLATYTPPEKAPAPITPSEAREARRAVESMEQEFVEVREAAKSGQRRPFLLSFDEKHVTTFLGSDEKASRAMRARGIEKPKVQFGNDSIVTSCYVTVRGRRVHVTTHGRLATTPEGAMRFVSDRVLLGRLPAPGPIKERVSRAINDYMMFGTTAFPAEVTEIRSEDGTLTITGVTEPRR